MVVSRLCVVPTTIEPPTPEDVTSCWTLIEKILSKGLLLERVVDAMSRVADAIQCPVFTTVLNFIAYSRMTPIRLVCEAVTQFNNYPWNVMFTNYPILKKDVNRIQTFLEAVNNDELAGLKFQGISQLIPNITYLSYQLHVQIGRKSIPN